MRCQIRQTAASWCPAGCTTISRAVTRRGNTGTSSPLRIFAPGSNRRSRRTRTSSKTGERRRRRMDEWNLLRFGWSGANGFFFYVSWVLVVGAVALALIGGVLARVVPRWFSRYGMVEADISLGRVGDVKLQANTKDVQIAHQIWTELVTRKAAIPIDPDRDVITEVYGSWYQLFQRMRVLISD